MNYNNTLIELIKNSKNENEVHKFILGQIIEEIGSHVTNYDKKDREIVIEIKDMQDHFDADYYLFTYKNKTYDLYSYWKKENEMRKKGVEAANHIYENTVKSFNLNNYKKRLKEFIQLGEDFKKYGFNIKLYYDKEVEEHTLENSPSRWWMTIELKL